MQAWTSLIHRVHAMNPEAPIICLEPVPSAISPLAGLWIKEACERAQGEGIAAHYIALNTSGPLLAPEDFVGDGTHPTKAGSAKLAAYLAPRIAPLLPKN